MLDANDDTILHEDDVKAVIDAEIDDNDNNNVLRGTATVTSPNAQGATYNQADVASLKTSIDQIRTILTAQHVSG